ncbi:hypothetical protein BH09PAT1_BH09PAT1_2810 [soil metagenome]
MKTFNTKLQDLPITIKDGRMAVDFPKNEVGDDVYGVHICFYEVDKFLTCLAYDFNPTDLEIWEKFKKYKGVKTSKTVFIKKDWTGKEC